MRDDRPPDQLTRDELRARIVKNARKVYRECRQCVIDGEAWMSLHPTERTIDLEWFKVNGAAAASVLRQLGEPLEG